MKTFEVWAQLNVCKRDCIRVRDFFTNVIGIKRRFTIKNLHLTVYHSRRPLDSLGSFERKIHVYMNTSDTRFMVLAPGGENRKLELPPTESKVGIRIKRNSVFFQDIMDYRSDFFVFETRSVLGKRKPSNHRRSAFGAKHFQPHIAFLRAGNGLDFDLASIGLMFRDHIQSLTFDKFIVQVKVKSSRLM